MTSASLRKGTNKITISNFRLLNFLLIHVISKFTLVQCPRVIVETSSIIIHLNLSNNVGKDNNKFYIGTNIDIDNSNL